MCNIVICRSECRYVIHIILHDVNVEVGCLFDYHNHMKWIVYEKEVIDEKLAKKDKVLKCLL